MRIREITSNGWLQCENEHSTKHSIYKLHAALPVAQYNNYHAKIYNVLKKAVEDGVIPAFKMLNIGGSEELVGIVGADSKITDSPHARLFNNPFTLYLHEDVNAEQILALIERLESILKYAPSCNREHLSMADLEFTPHFTFRQETLAGNYIAIARASQTELQMLKVEGAASREYKNLQEVWDSNKIKAKVASTADAKVQAEQNENLVQGFYNNNYNYYERELNSDDIAKQYQAACTLLEIDKTVFGSLLNFTDDKKSEQDIQKAQEFLNKKYKQACLRFHPDKILEPKIVSTKDKANSLFILLQKANHILKIVIANPVIIDKKKILAQEPRIPQYQYELDNGFVDDPYYYMHMARDTSYFIVAQNWEFVREITEFDIAEQKHVAESEISLPTSEEKFSHTENQRELKIESVSTRVPAENSRALQIYTPKLQIYDKNDVRRRKKMRGYEAFYHLFMCGALPRRFAQGHFHMIFSLLDSKVSIINEAEQWLVKKVLTTPDFIVFMDTLDFYRLATRATLKGIVDIGNDATQVLLYLYKNYPETLYSRRLQRLMACENFNIDIFVSGILTTPENLDKVSEIVLAQFSKNPPIRKYIFAKKALCVQLRSAYLFSSEIKSFFETKKHEIDELIRNTILQLTLGNSAFLSYFTVIKLTELKILIKRYPQSLPAYLCDDIDQEIMQQNTREYTLATVSCMTDGIWHSSKPPLQPMHCIKKIFLSGNTHVVSGLNKDALISLAEQPEIHWSDYLPIAEAFIAMKENTLAIRYLNCIINELNIKTTETSAEKLFETITLILRGGSFVPQLLTEAKVTHEDEKTTTNVTIDPLTNANKVWRDERVTILLAQYDKALSGEEMGEPEQIFAALELFGEKSKVAALSINSHYYESSKKELIALLVRLKAGDDPETLFPLFLKARNIYERTGRTWSFFLQHDLFNTEHHHILGDDIYNLIGSIIGKKRFHSLYQTPDVPIPSKRFGINIAGNPVENLKRIFNICKCLAGEDDFYEQLQMHTRETRAFEKIVIFNDKVIHDHLLAFVSNEFAVYVAGERENVSYKTSRFVDEQNISAFSSINSLYCRLGEERQLQELLPNAYEKLRDRAKITYGRVENSALIKYIEIRRCQKIVDPVLESLAIGHQLHAMLRNNMQYWRLERSIWPFHNNNYALAFRDEVSDLFSAVKGGDQAVTTNTRAMLSCLTKFLSHASDLPIYTELLCDLRHDPILGDYVGLRELDEKQLPLLGAKKAIATISMATAPLLRLQNPNIGLLTLRSNAEVKREYDASTSNSIISDRRLQVEIHSNQTNSAIVSDSTKEIPTLINQQRRSRLWLFVENNRLFSISLAVLTVTLGIFFPPSVLFMLIPCIAIAKSSSLQDWIYKHPHLASGMLLLLIVGILLPPILVSAGVITLKVGFFSNLFSQALQFLGCESICLFGVNSACYSLLVPMVTSVVVGLGIMVDKLKSCFRTVSSIEVSTSPRILPESSEPFVSPEFTALSTNTMLPITEDISIAAGTFTCGALYAARMKNNAQSGSDSVNNRVLIGESIQPSQ